MKIIFLTPRFSPHIGGVEKHVFEISRRLLKKGHKVTVITDKYNDKLPVTEVIDSIRVIRFSYPKIKILGLIVIWNWIFKNRNLIIESDLMHIHDVFIWYFPFCLIYPKKSIVTTIHGLEWNRPLNYIGAMQKRLAVVLSNKTVGIGNFLEKYLRVSFNQISYGAANESRNLIKNSKKIVYVGRLEKNTGLLKFLDWLKKNNTYKVDFCGDGELRNECFKYGTVQGFIDPEKFYKRAKYCVPGGYLAALEALNAKCELKLFWNNQVKEDYWKMSPFYKLKGEKLRKWAREQTWEKLANEYLDLYNSIK